jgi:hypothetical protein
MAEPTQPPEELIDILDTFYADDPAVGDIVMIRHNFENTHLVGEVTGMKRDHGHRGYEPKGDYEVIVYHEMSLRFGGIKKWLKVGEDEDWSLVTILDDKDFHKLGADVVLKETVNEFINREDNEDEL